MGPFGNDAGWWNAMAASSPMWKFSSASEVIRNSSLQQVVFHIVCGKLNHLFQKRKVFSNFRTAAFHATTAPKPPLRKGPSTIRLGFGFPTTKTVLLLARRQPATIPGRFVSF